MWSLTERYSCECCAGCSRKHYSWTYPFLLLPLCFAHPSPPSMRVPVTRPAPACPPSTPHLPLFRLLLSFSPSPPYLPSLPSSAPPLSPPSDLWQRGLALYYLGKFQEAAEQFRKDVAVNPNDTEEAIWCFLSEARVVGAQQARQQFLLVGQDPRPVMCAAMDVFQTGGDPKKILAAAAADFGRPSALFYANLYVGLFHESEVRPS
ncbi:unnamed protein product [Closterium sp. NIES-65]|nr:unnamed protein product [Closterium sp. NIES-65]